MKKQSYIKYFLILFSAFFLFTYPSYSQQSDLSFDYVTIDDGLSQNSVNYILQDSYGFMWFATQGGLNKYNGSNNEPFDIYLHSIYDTNSLSDSWAFSIDEDKQGNIWIGTINGLNKLERKTGNIIRYLHDPDDPNSINGERVFAVHVDQFGTVWAKTKDALNKLDTATGKFSYYEPYYDHLNESSGLFNTPIFEDSKGNLWVGTKDGLNLFNRDYEQFSRIRMPKPDWDFDFSNDHNKINAVYEDSDGYIWIGTSNGLNKYDPETRQIISYYHDENNPNSLSNNDVRVIIQDFMGYLWIGTYGGGLNRMDIKSETFTVYKPDQSNPKSFNHELVISICIDKSNILWVGTYGGGLNRVDLKKKKFELYSTYNISLNHNDIAGIFKNDDGKLWIGTWGKGLNIYDEETGEIELITASSPENRRLINDFVHVIYKDSRGLIWMGTRKGLNIFDLERDEIYTLDKIFGQSNLNSRVNDIEEDKYNNLWICTEQGLYYLNFERNEVVNYTKNLDDPESISSSYIYSVVEDKEGFVWVATDMGLNRFNPVTGVFKKYKSDVRNSNTISNNRAFSVIEDSEGYLWIGTGSGLNRFSKKDTIWTIYTKSNGLPNDLIYNAVEDNKGNLWMTTGYGLASLNKETNQIRSFDKADGLGSPELNLGSVYKSKCGEIYFGGIKGINVFHPDSLFDNNIKPDIVLLKYIKTNNSGTQTHNLEGIDKIELAWSDYGITIFFAALEYTNSGKNRYKYKVDELNEDWIELGTQNFRTFSSLPPGEYTFRVIGSNNDLVWSDKEAVLKIVVKPPFWRTPWAYVAYVLIVVLVAYYAFRLRTRKLRNANQALRVKQMAALEIAKQKEELSVKNKSITDSINYAKRIQEAMMPSEYLFKKLFPQSFILYKPKDIVSGDFYWITEKNNKIFVAAVDCTGHGVPGAFMSIIGFDLLRNITKEQGIENPAQILNQLNSGVSETFSKHVEDEEVKDGMDVSLCVIDRNQKIIEYSGAMNPLYIARDNKIIEIKGNRFSVGTIGFSDESQKFENHSIPYKEGDVIYLFSDGYPDQFGGPLGKKFKYRRFRHLLLTIHNLSINKQKSFLDENIENWRGELEQVDDILIIGIKL